MFIVPVIKTGIPHNSAVGFLFHQLTILVQATAYPS